MLNYIQYIRNYGAWGDELTLAALSDNLQINICVISYTSGYFYSSKYIGNSANPIMHEVAYHSNHYDVIRKIDDTRALLTDPDYATAAAYVRHDDFGHTPEDDIVKKRE